jgi:hypothetical protein
MVFEKILGNLLKPKGEQKRMNLRFTIKYIVLLFIIFNGAMGFAQKSITIEIPEPAQKELPNRIQSLLIVSRSVDDKYTDIPVDTLQNEFYKKNFSVDTLYFDKAAVDSCLMATGDLLFESGRYDIVIPEDRFLAFEENAFFSKEMDWTEVKTLCEQYNTDALLSLDMFKTQIKTEYSKESYFDPVRDGFYTAAQAQMVIIYDALFRVYDPLEEKVLVREFFKDTLVWEDAAYNTSDLFKNFTPVKLALSEAGVAVALDFSEKISTVWRREKRPIFIKGDKKLKLAGDLIDSGDFNQATAVWEELVESSKSKATRSKAQFNLAIAYEIQGDIDQSVKWALDSYNTMYRPITYRYLELLKQRKKEIQKQNK